MKRVILAILILSSFTSLAQPGLFESSIDTNRILIGEQIVLSLRAELDEGVDFAWPVLSDTLEGIEILETGSLDTASKNGRWILTQKLTITSFDSGYVAVPPMSFTTPDQNILSPAIGINVGMPQLDAEKELYDIKEPLEPPFNWLPLALWIVGAIVLIAAIIVLVRWLMNRQKTVQLSPEQQLSPYEYALLQLEEIRREQLWQAGKIKEHYSRLTDVIRLYMERQMRVNAMESTADEVITQIRGLRLSRELEEDLAELMSTSALVKFAKARPELDENERSTAIALEFLEATKPRIEQEEVE